jgi:hypothetical protein
MPGAGLGIISGIPFGLKSIGETMGATQDRVQVFDKPLILSGSHEPLIFRRRAGYAAADEEQRFEYEHSEDLVRKLAGRGINWVRMHFFKGFGLEAERDEIEMTRAFTALCHEHGIRVELYTQFGTLQYETFLAEAPDAMSWCSVNEYGQPVSISYGHHDFRIEPCLVRDGYWKYFQKVLRLGIDHVRADGFGFDNVANPTEPAACHCPECRQAFVQFLRSKYKPETPEGKRPATERFGFAVFDHIRPPTFNRWCPSVTCRIIKNPVFQEWAQFRAEILRRRIEEIWHFVKGIKPDIMIEYNSYRPFGTNGTWWTGIEMHRLLPWMDAFWNERPPHAPEFRGDGLHWNRVHGYKLGRQHGAVVFTFHQGRNPEQRKLAVAESLAFGGGHISGLGKTTHVAGGGYTEADAFIAFRKAHPELYEGLRSAAEVALFESVPSIIHNSVEPHYAGVLAVNGLLAGHLPFDLISEVDPETLARYSALAMPDVECLSDEESERVMHYVRMGGGVVLTERTSLYDQWRRRRPEPAFAPMLKEAPGFDAVEFGREVGEYTNVAQTEKAGRILRGTCGNGRFVYLSRLEPVKPFSYSNDERDLDTSYWNLPKNWRQFAEAVAWAAQGKLPFKLTGPESLAVEALRSADGRLVLHLVNYRLDKAAARVSLTLAGRKASVVRLWTPWGKKPRCLRIDKRDGSWRVGVGVVARYAVVEIS